MGCGSSSLKGDAPSGVNANDDPAPRPLKKVGTNFSTVDYEPSNAKNRRHTEYAPHETERQPSAIDEAVEHAKNGVEEAPKKDAVELKPYQTIEGDDPLSPSEAPASSSAPVSNGVYGEWDPTSMKAKDEFAGKNDPASSAKQLNGEESGTGEGEKQRKQSWLGKKYQQYSDEKQGRNKEISDEDMKKYTGKSKDEITEFVEEGDGVGGKQSASFRDTPGPGTGISGLANYSG